MAGRLRGCHQGGRGGVSRSAHGVLLRPPRVFLKPVRSTTKFWQMVGRGTRLRKDLFGPGKDKAFFYILDYCENLEFFSHNPATTDGSLGESLGKRLFRTRLELVSELDRPSEAPPRAVADRVSDLHVPAGFKVSVFASDLAGARMMTVSPEGVLLVACRRTNEVVALPTRTTKALSIESRTAESDDTDSCAM